MENSWINNLTKYEPGRPLEEVARELGCDPSALVKLASNENDLGPSPKAVLAIQEASTSVHLYPDGGTFYLRQAISNKWGLSPEQIIPGNGSNELIEFLGHVFLNRQSSIVMSEQAFVVYKLVAALFEAETIEVPTHQFTHDLEAMRAAIRGDTRLVFIANPNNPTGTCVSNTDLKNFVKQVPEEVIVVIDEAYIELLDPADQPDTIQMIRDQENVCILRTFSKVYGLAGLRIGYLMASEKLVSLCNHVRQPFNVNQIAQLAARAALGDDEHVALTRTMVEKGYTFITKSLSDMGLEYVPSVTNFLLVKTGEGRKVFEELQREEVIVRPMDGYGLPDYIRVTIGRAENNRTFISALKKISLSASVKESR